MSEEHPIAIFERMINSLSAKLADMSNKIDGILFVMKSSEKELVFNEFIRNFVRVASIETSPNFVANQLVDLDAEVSNIIDKIDMFVRPYSVVVSDEVSAEIGNQIKEITREYG
jgi:hypothetical protein